MSTTPDAIDQLFSFTLNGIAYTVEIIGKNAPQALADDAKAAMALFGSNQPVLSDPGLPGPVQPLSIRKLPRPAGGGRPRPGGPGENPFRQGLAG